MRQLAYRPDKTRIRVGATASVTERGTVAPHKGFSNQLTAGGIVLPYMAAKVRRDGSLIVSLNRATTSDGACRGACVAWYAK